MSTTLQPFPLHPPHGSMPHSDPSQAACPWIKGENYTEMSLKTCSSTKAAICNLLLGVVRCCSGSLFFVPPPQHLSCAVFSTPRRLNSNVCHPWLCFTQVGFIYLFIYFLHKVGLSRLTSGHVPEELPFYLLYRRATVNLEVGIFQGHAERHSHSCMVIKCKRLPTGLWQRRRRFPSHSQIFSPRF